MALVFATSVFALQLLAAFNVPHLASALSLNRGGRGDFRGTVGNALAGVVGAVAPGSCIADLAMTGYRNDQYDEDDYGFQPSCYGHGSENGISCFPGTATALDRNGNKISLAKLQIGDEVLVFDSDIGVPIYESVLFFLHRDPDGDANDWIDVEFDGGRLTMSSTHLLLQQASNEDANFISVAAKRLSKGDIIHLATATSFNVTRVRSVRLSAKTNQHRGIFAPVTNSGTIFVDGVLTSSYSSLDLFGDHEKYAHRILHVLTAPMRKAVYVYATVEELLPKLTASRNLGLSKVNISQTLAKFAVAFENKVRCLYDMSVGRILKTMN